MRIKNPDLKTKGKDSAWYKREYERAHELLRRAQEHLDYCGYGDAWEREVSEDLFRDLTAYAEEHGWFEEDED